MTLRNQDNCLCGSQGCLDANNVQGIRFSRLVCLFFVLFAALFCFLFRQNADNVRFVSKSAICRCASKVLRVLRFSQTKISRPPLFFSCRFERIYATEWRKYAVRTRDSLCLLLTISLFARESVLWPSTRFVNFCNAFFHSALSSCRRVDRSTTSTIQPCRTTTAPMPRSHPTEYVNRNVSLSWSLVAAEHFVRVVVRVNYNDFFFFFCCCTHGTVLFAAQSSPAIFSNGIVIVCCFGARLLFSYSNRSLNLTSLAWVDRQRQRSRVLVAATEHDSAARLLLGGASRLPHRRLATGTQR
jgi:hypothetical protein